MAENTRFRGKTGNAVDVEAINPLPVQDVSLLHTAFGQQLISQEVPKV